MPCKACVSSHGCKGLDKAVYDVQTYSGKGDSGSGKFTMQYQLEGNPEKAASLCNAVGRMPSVLSWSLGCSLPEGSQGFPSPMPV